MEKEKEMSLLSRPGDSDCSSVIRTGITLPDDSNVNRGQVTQHTEGRENKQITVHSYNMVTATKTTSQNSIYVHRVFNVDNTSVF